MRNLLRKYKNTVVFFTHPLYIVHFSFFTHLTSEIFYLLYTESCFFKVFCLSYIVLPFQLKHFILYAIIMNPHPPPPSQPYYSHRPNHHSIMLNIYPLSQAYLTISGVQAEATVRPRGETSPFTTAQGILTLPSSTTCTRLRQSWFL